MAHMRNTDDPEVAAPRPAGLTGPQAQSVGDAPALRQRSPDEQETSHDPTPPRFLQAPGRWQRWMRRTGRERRPFTLALLLSLLVHVLVLSLTFGGDTLGVPGLVAPWREQRIEVPDLRVVLVPARFPSAEPADKAVAEPSQQQLTIDPPVAGGAGPTLPVSPALPPPAKAVANAPVAEPTAQVDATRGAVASAAPVKAPARATEPEPEPTAPVPVPESARVEVLPSDEPSPVVLTAPLSPTYVNAAAPSASSPQTVPSASKGSSDVVQEPQREDAARQEAARVEAVRLETERQEAARQVAAQQEAQRLDTARQEADRVEAARLETERQNAARQVAAQLAAQREEAVRQEAARAEAERLQAERQQATRQEAARLEVQRQEAERQEAARVAAARLEAERQNAARQAAVRLEEQRREAAGQEEARVEAARLETERQSAARQAAARIEAQRLELARQDAARAEAARQEAARQATAAKEAARLEAEKDDAAKREAVLRAIGRQLDEEAARRDAASKAAQLPNTLPYSLSTARRVRLWGRSDPNVELVQYAEAWARKIQFNTAVEMVRELAKQPHTPPMVTVAVRSDGSVESVTFVVSSGVAEIDEAIKRIVESQRPYLAFPPALARQFDVIEIRRTWYLDSAVRLQ